MDSSSKSENPGCFQEGGSHPPTEAKLLYISDAAAAGQALSRVGPFVTPQTAVGQASLSFTISRSWTKYLATPTRVTEDPRLSWGSY